MAGHKPKKKEHIMRINDGRITLVIDKTHVTIEIHDKDAAQTFVRVKMTSNQFCQALARLAYTPCESVEVNNLDKVGKKMETLCHPIPLPWDECYSAAYKEGAIKEIAQRHINQFHETVAEDGWIDCTYFGSQDSFRRNYTKKEIFVNAVFRRWV